MKRQQPEWLRTQLYPFTSRWIDLDGDTIHYVDEGQGPPIIFVHGTPEWSFAYRDVIRVLRSTLRCIAIDLLGFGLSDKPDRADYSCKGHAARLQKFIDKLNIEGITFVANDFGGGIALDYAIHNPHKVSHIVLSNTWMRSLVNDKHYSGPARILSGWFGKWLYEKMNLPVNVIMPAAYGNRSKLTKEIHRHYKRALPMGKRRATFAFAGELMTASPWWQSNWDKLTVIEDKPFLIFWGAKDKFVPLSELDRWKTRLPDATTIVFEDAGHFVAEEKGREMATAIARLLGPDRKVNGLTEQMPA